MNAYQLHAIGDLRYENCQAPEISGEWSLVKVKACGICSSDISRVFTKGTYHFPTIPGHEFSGIVECVGNHKNARLVGKKVGIFPLMPCFKCEQCKLKRYEMCSHYDYIGSRRNGGFAEYVAVPVWNLMELPSEISYVEAAMLEPLSVALHAVKKGLICKGDAVAVIGTGMIAFSAAQWSKMFMPSDVCVISRNLDKKIIADNLEVQYATNSNVKYDVIIEAVGTCETVKRAIEMVKPGGRIVLVGNPDGDIVLGQDDYWKILRKQVSVVGTWNSSYESNCPSDWTEACGAIVSRSISVLPLISHLFSQENLLEGLYLMKNHKVPYCKVMVRWNTDSES